MSEDDLNVVVIGNLGVDTNIYLPGRDIDFNLEANFSENIDCLGQAGGYASRSYVEMGIKTAFIGCVGDDFSGRFIMSEFRDLGVDTSGIFTDPAGTSRSINFMNRDGKRKNFYDGKSHMNLKPDLNRCREILGKSRLGHFNIPNWARQLLPIARELGLRIACDIQDVVDPGDPYREDFINFADFLFFSAANHADSTPIMEAWLKRNPEQVIIAGMGDKGCALGAGGNIRIFSPAALDLPVVDTNGAGDVLASVFLTSHIFKGLSMEDSIKRGQIAARIVCSQKAPKVNFFTSEQVESIARN
jgi:sugar/nucleoside kinase (ribokinase family)